MSVIPYTEGSSDRATKQSMLFNVRRTQLDEDDEKVRFVIDNFVDLHEITGGLSLTAFYAKAKILDDKDSVSMIVNSVGGLVEKLMLRVRFNSDMTGPYAVHYELEEGEDPNDLMTVDELEEYINALSTQARKRFFNSALIK